MGNFGNFGISQLAENNLCGISSQKVGTALAGETNPSKYPNELPSLPFRTYPPISAPIGARLSV
jgi:hypothetical protein